MLDKNILKLTADTFVDVISEQNISSKLIENKSYKSGFFLQKSFSVSRTTLKNRKKLITERYLLDLINKGEKRVSFNSEVIITPAARLIIEEGKIKLDE
ncbi:MAG: hypothetical protein PF545_04535 [Elusimicrobia bacterium]|jgi:hypothetical protein|nr:hypothetical protein [Elusimicrobiota bacterium]